MAIAYLDCFSGISGDMVLGALLDTGLSLSDLQDGLKNLPLGSFSLRVSREERSHIAGTRVQVESTEDPPRERCYSDIVALIQQSSLPGPVKKQCLDVFHCLASAEARIHGQAIDRVHFHEIGAVDSIIDIVGAVLGFHQLHITTIICSSLPLGSGLTGSRHGSIPVPAPATAEILTGVPVYGSGVPYELVTPTGAALVKTLATSFSAVPPMTIHRTGYGVGTRHLADRPNLLRILVGSDPAEAAEDSLIVIETTVDDMNPEFYDHVMHILFEQGALDVFMVPVHMKKNRPGIVLTVVAENKDRETLSRTLFMQTSTAGVRYYPIQRRTLTRETETVSTAWGDVRVKVLSAPDGQMDRAPEYEDCRRIASEHQVPLKRVYQEVLQLAARK